MRQIKRPITCQIITKNYLCRPSSVFLPYLSQKKWWGSSTTALDDPLDPKADDVIYLYSPER